MRESSLPEHNGGPEPSLPTLSQRPRVSALLARWEERYEQGQNVPAEELCRDCPELLEPLRRQIAALTSMPLPQIQAAPAWPTVPGYEILGELGRGGMGVVYKARQVRLGRVVALKMLLTGPLAATDEVDRFRKEAEAAARLRHGAIVQVYDVGECAGQVFFAMEYLEGGALADRLAGTPLPIEDAARIVETLAGAMQHAHERGVLHRDLKPANVLFGDDGQPRISDFGLVKLLGEQGQTQTGAVLGTPSYMAPEQARGKNREVGPAADVYALGAVLYECLTGSPPFRGATAQEVMLQVLTEEPPPPSRLRARLPRDLETIALQCLAKAADQRYASAGELAEDLRRFRAGEPIRARPVGRLERLWRWSRRNPVVAGLTAALTLLLLSTTVAATLIAFDMSRLARSEKQATQKAIRNAEGEQAARIEATSKGESLRRELSLQYVANGSRALDDGDDSLALLWFAKALDLDRDDPERVPAHQLRLANTWRQMPRLTGMYFHDAPLTWTELSPDGRRAVTASYDDTARVWDVSTGKPIGRPLCHTGYVFCARFSPDGKRVATASGDATAQIWDAETGKPLSAPLKHAMSVCAAAFSPDGEKLATSCDNPALWWPPPAGVKGYDKTRAIDVVSPGKPGGTVWDLKSGTHLSLPCANQVGAPSFSKDGRRVAFAGPNVATQAVVCDAVTGKILAGPFVHNEPHPKGTIVSVVLSPDAKHLLTGTYGSKLRIWDVSTGKVVGTPLSGSRAFFGREGALVVGRGVWKTATREVVHLPDARMGSPCDVFCGQIVCNALTAGQLGARIWEVSGRRPLTPILRSNVRIRGGGGLGPGGRLALLPGGDHAARLWDRAAQVPLLYGPAAYLCWGARYSPDGRRMVTAVPSGTPQVWDPATGRPVARLGYWSGTIPDAVFSPDGAKILTAGHDRTARLWDAATGAALGPPLAHERMVRRVFFDSSGARAVTVSGERLEGVDAMHVWDLKTRKQVWEDGDKLSRLQASVSPDGRLVAAGGDEGVVRVRDLATGRAIAPDVTHDYGSRSPVLSPDGKLLATCGGDMLVKVWEVPSGKMRFALSYQSTSNWTCFSPDGTCLAVGDHDGTLRVWDAASGSPRTPLMQHGSATCQLAFDPTGRFLLSGAVDGTAQVWDARTGERLGPWLRTPKGVLSASFRPDGRQVLVACAEGAYLFPFTPEDRSPEDWLLLAGVQSGHRIDRHGSLAPLSAAELRSRWDEFGRRFPADCRVEKAQVKAWYFHEARRLIFDHCNADALNLLSGALALFPEDPELCDQRGTLALQAGQFALAIQDKAHAAALRPQAWLTLPNAYRGAGRSGEGLEALSSRLKDDPGNAHLWWARSRLHAFARQWGPAAEDLTRAIELGPHRHILAERGCALAELGRWRQARDDFARARAEEPLNPGFDADHAWTMLGQGDLANFKKEVGLGGLGARMGVRLDLERPNEIAWLLALTPHGDHGAAMRWAKYAADHLPRKGNVLNTLALAKYRMRDFKGATAHARAALVAHGEEGTPFDWLILALAQAGLGNAAEARIWLEKTRDWCALSEKERRNSTGSALNWQDRVALDALRREADAVVGKLPAPGKDGR